MLAGIKPSPPYPTLGTEKKAAPHFIQLLAIHLAELVAVQAFHISRSHPMESL